MWAAILQKYAFTLCWARVFILFCLASTLDPILRWLTSFSSCVVTRRIATLLLVACKPNALDCAYDTAASARAPARQFGLTSDN
ncbi:hypothetical protein B0H19DRAFT_1156765 [Mycena capillaripes]|nr:hypothetical protein B0H19DRAFT_1156765 [Mycena capillaripes]